MENTKVVIENGMLNLAGTRWPLCGLICPPHADRPEELDRDLLLGGSGPNGLYIPFESGLFIDLIQDDHQPTWTAAARHRSCDEVRFGQVRCWLPTGLKLIGREFFAATGPHEWRGAETDWLNEHMERISRFPIRGIDPDAPECQIISWDRAHELLRCKYPEMPDES